ncbi:MAG: hypothetical protein AB7V08_11030 [Elusimicrobiales bacterium]
MLRRLLLTLTDRRLGAALAALRAAGPALGDLAAAPAGAAEFFRPFRVRLHNAAEQAGEPRSLAALAAAMDFTARLEKTFSDMALLQAPPDRAALEALARMQLACGAADDLLYTSRRALAFASLRAAIAEGRRLLASAKAAADRSPESFTQNLKFSSIYSGLDGAFDSLERCAEALFRA